MKCKIKHEKSNLVFMSSVLVLCLISCVMFLLLRHYLNALIYFILTLLIAYTYYFTYYYLKDDYLIVRLGFIKVKFQYRKIVDVLNEEHSVKIKFSNISINIYPSNKDIFYNELKSKVKGIE